MQRFSFSPWTADPEGAIKIQDSLRRHVKLCRLAFTPRFIGGADVSYSRDGTILFAAVVVLDHTCGVLLDNATIINPVHFAYLPGMLAFREGPPLLQAFSRLSHLPDLIMFDGYGTFHPRGFGLASHMGVLLDLPTIGCAKSPFFKELPLPASNRGSWRSKSLSPVQKGASVRTKTRCNPVFVSPGHKITLGESIHWVLKTTGRYRVPEPIRQAHSLANKVRGEYRQGKGFEVFGQP